MPEGGGRCSVEIIKILKYPKYVQYGTVLDTHESITKPTVKVMCRFFYLLTLLCCMLAGQAGAATLTITSTPPVGSTGWEIKNGSEIVVSYDAWKSYVDKLVAGEALIIEQSITKLTITGGSGKDFLPTTPTNISVSAGNTHIVFTGGHLNLSGTSTLGAISAGTVTAEKDVTFNGPASFSGQSTFNSKSTFNETLFISGDAIFKDDTYFLKQATVTGKASFDNITGNSEYPLRIDVNLTVGTIELLQKFSLNDLCKILDGPDGIQRLTTKVIMVNSGNGGPSGVDGQYMLALNADGKIVDVYEWNEKTQQYDIPSTLKDVFGGNYDKNTCLNNMLDVLPINLLHFSAARTPMGVAISWKVDRDELLSFQVERSEDGHVFLPLTSLSGIYTYTDAQAPASVLWYRLRISNPKGEYMYSTAMQISPQVSQGLQVAVSPNPLQNGRLQAYIRSDRPFGQLQLRLTDLQGRLLGQQTLRTDAGGQAQWSMDVATSSGMLLLQVTDGQDIQTVKVLEQ